MAITTPDLGLLVLVVAIAPVLLIISARAPVTPQRVARFARRQQLPITSGNGEQVIRYLATTRRWRVAGFVTAYVLTLVWVMVGATLVTFGVLQLLAGWFIGAVIAEARLARRPRGALRRALLLPRQPAAYLSRSARLAMPVVLGVSLLVAVFTLVVAQAGQEVDARPALARFAAAVLVAAVVWEVGRRVLGRPQPADLPPDQLAADDAIRSRSLHVLAGAGTALVLYAVGYQLDALAIYPLGEAASAVTRLGRMSLVVLAPLLGWLIATNSWAVTRPAARLA